jgi:hypothetical protein
MTPEEQRIAIAEVHFASLIAGYELCQQPKGTEGYRDSDLSGCWIYRKGDDFYGMNYDSKEDCFRDNVKRLADKNDYPSDLNAMNEAEKIFDVDILSGDSPRYAYSRFVYQVCEKELYLQPFRAGAAQRAEAFLRTVGKWKERQQ